jgi:hypothetical protein
MKDSATRRRAPGLAFATLMLLGSTLPAASAPPTVTPSPGYDARLQESRSANTPPPNQAPQTHRHTRHRPHKSGTAGH